MEWRPTRKAPTASHAHAIREHDVFTSHHPPASSMRQAGWLVCFSTKRFTCFNIVAIFELLATTVARERASR